MKPVVWLGDSLATLRQAPEAVRSDAGYQIELVQNGDSPADFRPMPDVGPGAIEIRIHGPTEYRVFYIAKFEEAVYILHCFMKKSRTTRKADLEIGRSHYRMLVAARQGANR